MHVLRWIYIYICMQVRDYMSMHQAYLYARAHTHTHTHTRARIHIALCYFTFSQANLRYRELNDALERTQGQLRDAGVSCHYMYLSLLYSENLLQEEIFANHAILLSINNHNFLIIASITEDTYIQDTYTYGSKNVCYVALILLMHSRSQN